MTGSEAPAADLLIEDIGELVPLRGNPPPWEPAGSAPWPERLHSAAIASLEGRVVWIGESAAAPASITLVPGARRITAAGALVTPGLVDSHTHLVFGGSRSDEFFRRLRGVSYREIAAEGGGIRRTVRETRAAPAETLLAGALERAATMLRWGTTTIEIKSGYGLELDTELKMLHVIARLQELSPLDVVPTFLGAHEVPSGWTSSAYLDHVVGVILPAVSEAGLAAFCDVFCERGVFDVNQSRRVLEAGLDHGLRPKIHAEQLSHYGGSALAAELGAASADHLEHATALEIRALAEQGVVGGLLPGASLFLGTDEYAPAELMREAGMEIALATDCNPGTCMTEAMGPILFLGVVKLGLSPGEALRAACLGGARSLGLGERVGSLEPGKQADLVIWNVPDLEELFYHFGVNHVRHVIKNGRLAWSAEKIGAA